MPGFLAIIGHKVQNSFSKEKRLSLLVEEKHSDKYYIARRTINKFASDKIFVDNTRYLLLIEGIILNKAEIFGDYSVNNDFTQTIINAYESGFTTFFNQFRGSFSGLLYDKISGTCIVFTDHIGDKQIFYAQWEGSTIIGSEPGFVFEFFKNKGINLTLNYEAACMLLTYGFFLENHTIASEIIKLTAGHYLQIKDNVIKEIQYHRFSNSPISDKSINYYIEGVDYYFRQAIRRQFEKDKEYGYKHITTLSGGLDSRMTVWVSHEMGYTNQLNTTFSQSNYLDETIAKQIATDLNHEWLFKSLNAGGYLMDADLITKITYGGGLYAGLAHGKSLYDLINFDSFGIMHTGQIGDSILGTFYKKPISGTPYAIGDGAYSIKLINQLEAYSFRYSYDNQEIFALYNRAFNGANQGLLVFQEYTESYSPFTDVDFIEFCYSIPVALRYKHRIYFEWIFKMYPNAASYIWERTKRKPQINSTNSTVNILGRQIPRDKIIQWIIGSLSRRLQIKRMPIDDTFGSSNSMNPYEVWYHSNPKLREYIDRYTDPQTYHSYSQDLINLISQINNSNPSITEKLQLITMLSAIKAITTPNYNVL